ncbi:hypothetical protein IFR05_010270 [Cadophora sp. M221]|nr:hypothetical protein IFR05_010270 [Cadophora sp. M221]
MPPMSFFKAIRDTVEFSVHNYDFRDDAFKSLIPRGMDTVSALNIFLGSPLLSNAEHAHLREFLAQYQIIESQFTRGAEPGVGDIYRVGMNLDSLVLVFWDDIRARGVYDPCFMAYTLNPDNSVMENHIWNNFTQTGSTIQGSVLGFPAGFPHGYVGRPYGVAIDGATPREVTVAPNLGQLAQTNNIKASHKGDEKGKGKEKEKERMNTDDANEAKRTSKKNESEFGDGFSKNIRGAFC